ncbi:MAG: hypothetical protein P4L33_02650 [Capsulimonadaceae bacterium]|nr:hypothetical protein [Capsulimonadaceae bacterium]
MHKKIVVGFVVQTFDADNRCIAQEFVAGDTIDYENEEGEPIPVPDAEAYFPMDMVQPK